MSELIRVKEETYQELRNLKFELRVETFEEVIRALLEEHKKR